MKILITGINGFGGTNFTNSWSKNHTLFGLARYKTSFKYLQCNHK